MVFRGLPRACWEFFFFKKELGSVTLKTNNQHTLVCVCGSPKRTNSIPAASVVCPTIPPGRANPFFLSCHNKCPLQRGLCACFVVSRITRSPPICAWPGACRAGRARDRGLNCPSWCVEGFRIGVSQGDLSGRGRTVGLRPRSLDLRSRPLCAEPRLRELCITQAMEDGVGGRGAAGGAAGGWEEDVTARSVLYLMMQRTLASAAPASCGKKKLSWRVFSPCSRKQLRMVSVILSFTSSHKHRFTS